MSFDAIKGYPGVVSSWRRAGRCLLVLLCSLMVVQASEFGRVPLSFEQNQGQTAADVRFFSRGDGSILYLTCNEAVLHLTGPQRPKDLESRKSMAELAGETAVLRMGFGGSGNACRAEGLDEQPGRSHYFLGRSSDRWINGVPLFGKVRYADVYPGIDLVFYGNERSIEYDFVVAPGEDPSQIRLTIDGAERLEVNDAGQLVASLGSQRIVQRKPVAYQPGEDQAGRAANGFAAKTNVDGRWKLLAANTVGFEIADYDRGRPLVIDPVIVYSTYLNGSMVSQGFDIVVDDQGASYIVGEATSPDFPVTAGVVQPVFVGGSRNAFITKLNPAGDQIVFSTFLGAGLDSAYGVAVDPQTNVYVTGDARSNDFPVTEGAFDSDPDGNTSFVAKLSPDGSQLIYSTFIGDGGESAGGIVVDDDGFAYISGQTTSPDFPVVNAVQPQESSPLPDAYIAKLNQDGTALVFATYWGGAEADEFAERIAIDEQRAVYVAGWTDASDFPTTPGAFQTIFGGVRDAFVVKLDPTGTQVVYSTLLGGTNRDHGFDVAVDFAGHAFVVGDTNSTDGSFPVTAGALKEEPQNVEGFVAKITPNGNALAYSTLLGGSANESLFGVAVDTAGHAYVTGDTTSLPDIETVNAIPGAEGEGLRARDANLFAKLRTDGSGALVLLGYGGGDDIEQASAIDIDGACHAYMTGDTSSKEYLTVNAVQPQSLSEDGDADAFVTKIDPAAEFDEPAIGCRAVVLATGTPVLREGTANSIMTVFGSKFAPPGTQALVPEVDGSGRVTTQLANTCVEVDGTRSPMFAVLENQLNFQNPHQLGEGYASYRVIRGCGTANEQASEPEHIWIRPAAPAFFNFVNNADGANPIAALHEDGVRFVGPPGLFGGAVETTPAAPGEFVSLFATGFGATTPSFEAGQVPGVTAELNTDDVQVTIGGIEIPPEDIFYIGVAPCCAGLYQLVVRIPPSLASGDHAVVVTIQGRSSIEGPYVTVQAP